MKELASLTKTIVEDRGIRKLRVNIVGRNRIFGFIKPI